MKREMKNRQRNNRKEEKKKRDTVLMITYKFASVYYKGRRER